MEERRSCNNCRLKRNGECFGKNKICQDYKYAPVITEEQARVWPKEMRHREDYRLPMRKDNHKAATKKASKYVGQKNQAQRKNEILLYETSNLNLYEFLKSHQGDIVIFGYGRETDKINMGYYRVAMVSKMHMKYMEDVLQETADRAFLLGILKVIQRITRSTPIYIFTTTHIGLGSSRGRDWRNADVYAKIEECIAIKNCKTTVCVLTENQEQIRELLLKQNRKKYFTVLSEEGQS